MESVHLDWAEGNSSFRAGNKHGRANAVQVKICCPLKKHLYIFHLKSFELQQRQTESHFVSSCYDKSIINSLNMDRALSELGAEMTRLENGCFKSGSITAWWLYRRYKDFQYDVHLPSRSARQPTSRKKSSPAAPPRKRRGVLYRRLHANEARQPGHDQDEPLQDIGVEWGALRVTVSLQIRLQGNAAFITLQQGEIRCCLALAPPASADLIKAKKGNHVHSGTFTFTFIPFDVNPIHLLPMFCAVLKTAEGLRKREVVAIRVLIDTPGAKLEAESAQT
ncbi:hypothetical protein F2P81_016483 [Scophthalmus maximus]|uniref:Uncharacterized protein n=1 Tax=Scophthalmus maximus TaxID=52904 RepID=A0A6A4SI93_SCOMX|nr:hypothetical protein F2P81_016483 [Scophthalmus maximus]